MMTTTFPKYESYQDSGVEWIGEIPSHWEISRAKRIFRSISEKNYPDAPLLSVTQDQGVIPRDELEQRVVMPIGQLQTFKLVKKDDFVISLRSFQGGIEYSKYTGLVSPAYTVLRKQKNINSGYLKWLLKSSNFISELNISVTGIRQGKNIDFEDFSLSFLPTPPIEEQKRIVDFLDRTTTDIDRAISQKQRLIELLQEQKAIVINQAVTKGLNPKVPMRDSRIEWLGEIPKHWSIKRAKQVSSIFVPQRNKPELNSSVGIPWVTTEDLIEKAVSGSQSGYFVSPIHIKQAGSRVLPENSVIASCIGNFGVASVNTQPVIINQQLQAFVPIKVNPWYLRYSISTSKSYFELNSTSTTLAYVNQEGFAEMPLPCPPDIEQREIVDFLEGKLIEIEGLTRKIEQQISNIQEFRQILISRAVTGKLKV